jgi:steroid delta-isomerase-like uncharacterized protein
MPETQITPTAIDPAWVEDFAQRWLAAWNSHDPDRLLALMTDDVVYDDSAWPARMHGHEDVREFLTHTWRALPDLRFELDTGPLVSRSEPQAAMYWTGTATHTGPIDPPGLAPTGKRLAFHGADFHEYRDELVSRLRIVFDMTDVMRQLGVLPAAGSRGERAMATLQRLQSRLPRPRVGTTG